MLAQLMIIRNVGMIRVMSCDGIKASKDMMNLPDSLMEDGNGIFFSGFLEKAKLSTALRYGSANGMEEEEDHKGKRSGPPILNGQHRQR
ncbi:unnamed protein product [Linum tenue]|uniref:Uncharacterized protein n=1 Tax=Linum tenue TaxID=586396 RepID=A0AAV0J372_9ROSI|nr:unnamed protein product [Linum tenue]